MNSTQQKQELFKTIWAIANELRGSVDGWDFKQYVLGMLFYRYISENITDYINRLQHEAGLTDFDYAAFSDEEALEAKEDIVREKGFFILPSQLFCNVRRRAKEDTNLNETLSAVFAAIEQSAVGRARTICGGYSRTWMSTPPNSATPYRSATSASAKSSTPSAT